jgi:hypothetical protein
VSYDNAALPMTQRRSLERESAAMLETSVGSAESSIVADQIKWLMHGHVKRAGPIGW